MRALGSLVIACFCVLALAAAVMLGSRPATSAEEERIDVVFSFDPSKPAYEPGENFTIVFTVTNTKMKSTEYPDEVMVRNLSAWFSWMGPTERFMQEVPEPAWLEPGELAVYRLNMSVPSNAAAADYTYKVWVDFYDNSYWGVDMDNEWSSVLLSGFTVRLPEAPDGGGEDGTTPHLWPYMAAAVAVVAVVAAIGYAYWSAAGKGGQAGGADRLGMAQVPSSASSELPVIRAAPGERFPIERGFVYLVKEKRPGIAFAMFNEAVNRGATGMLVVREHPNRLKQTHDFRAEKILWLTRRVGEDHIDPTELSLLSLQISKFIESRPKSVVLIEGLEYLITQNDFETVLRFVNHMHDFVLAHDCAVIIVLDPRVLSTREMALLERSARIVEPGDYGVVKPEKVAEATAGK